MTQKALITGGLGYSASWLIPKLLAQGWQVRITDLPTHQSGKNSNSDSPIEFIPADLTDPSSLSPIFEGIDVVFHTAALFSYTASLKQLRKVNVEGTRNVLNQSLKSGVKKLILWSSGGVYGNPNPKFYTMPIPELPIDRLNPDIRGHYDISKREQEELTMRFWEDHHFPVTIMRCASMYGPDSYYGIYVLLKYIHDETFSFFPFNYHNAAIALVHAEDIARAALFLADFNNYNGEIFNVADDNTLDMLETFQYIAHLTNSNFTTSFPLPRRLLFTIFSIIGHWSKFEARFLMKKIEGKSPPPKLETDTLRYFFGKYWLDNSKLKHAGFRLKYPDRHLGLDETIHWYNLKGWDKPHMRTFQNEDSTSRDIKITQRKNIAQEVKQ